MEKSDYKSVPKSPLLCSAGSYMSPHTLPPLKFHSGLLGKHSISTLGLSESDEQSVSNDSDDGGDESIASALYDLDGYYSEKFDQEFSWVDDVDDMRNLSCHGYDEGIMGLPEGSSASDRPHRPLINRALSKIDLKVELPKVVRRFNDVRQSEQFMTLDSCCQPLVSCHSFSTQVRAHSFQFRQFNKHGGVVLFLYYACLSFMSGLFYYRQLPFTIANIMM